MMRDSKEVSLLISKRLFISEYDQHNRFFIKKKQLFNFNNKNMFYQKTSSKKHLLKTNILPYSSFIKTKFFF